jgi:DNA-binding CsgD family transcriptional regulator
MNTEQQIKEEPCAIILKNATTINAINFTNREIDVIACILGGRSPKKIASFLAIATRTVEIHIRNIMLKIGCNSRESIIDFIERTNKLEEFKKHYFALLINLAFIKELKKIPTTTKEQKINCLILYYNEQKTKNGLINDLEDHLSLIGIKVTSKVWEKDKTNTFINNNIETSQLNYIIYVIDDKFIERLQGIENKIIEETQNLTYKFTGVTNPIIFLSLNNDNTKNFCETLISYTHINLIRSENYCFLFFELLKSLLTSHNIDKCFIEFKKQYELFDSVSVLKKSAESNELKIHNSLTIKTLSIANLIHLIKTSHLKWLIFFISPLCFSFVIFKINKEINLLTHKSQSIETTITNHYKNITINNQTKTAIFNLPLRNTNFTGRKQALIKIKEHLNQQKSGVVTQVICGFGGIGKTQLAIEFAYIAAEKNKYAAIFWIPAETTDSMRNGYETIANQLQFDVKGWKLNEIQTLIHNKLTKLYKNFKILFILDNVPNHDYINNFLTKLNNELSAHLVSHVLITSRSQYWPENTLSLDNFTPEESSAFIQKYLPNEEVVSINKLAKILYYFPLALSQAVTYIKKHTNIYDYLKLYETKQKDFLDKFSGDKNQHNESLWKTWIITINKLSNNAKELLFISAYLDPDEIPFDFFEKLSTENRGNSIEELRKYSFITLVNTKSFKIHRLLQEVIRLSINNNSINVMNNILKTDSYWLTKAIKSLSLKFDFNYLQPQKWKLCNKYLLHANSLANYAIASKQEVFYQGIKLYCKLAMFTTFVYYKKVDNSTKEIWEKIGKTIRQNFEGPELELIKASIDMSYGLVLEHGSEYNATQKCFDNAISIYRKYSSNPPKLSSIAKDLISSLAVVPISTEEVSEIIDYNLSYTLMRLANYYRALAQYDKAILILKEALFLIEKFKDRALHYLHICW